MLFRIITKLHRHKWSKHSFGRFCRLCNRKWKEYASSQEIPESCCEGKDSCDDCVHYQMCWAWVYPSKDGYEQIQTYYRTECIGRGKLLWRAAK